MTDSNVRTANEKMPRINDKPSQESCHTPGTAYLSPASALQGELGPKTHLSQHKEPMMADGKAAGMVLG